MGHDQRIAGLHPVCGIVRGDTDAEDSDIRAATPVENMDNQPAPDSKPSQAGATDSTAAAWQDLLAELTELHARLEYLRLLLKLGVRGF